LWNHLHDGDNNKSENNGINKSKKTVVH
jgi:hypothetical protein